MSQYNRVNVAFCCVGTAMSSTPRASSLSAVTSSGYAFFTSHGVNTAALTGG